MYIEMDNPILQFPLIVRVDDGMAYSPYTYYVSNVFNLKNGRFQLYFKKINNEIDNLDNVEDKLSLLDLLLNIGFRITEDKKHLIMNKDNPYLKQVPDLQLVDGELKGKVMVCYKEITDDDTGERIEIWI